MTHAGWSVRFFERIDDVEVYADEIVVGGLDPVVGALAGLGVDLPDIDYPETFRDVLVDPEVERTTMGPCDGRPVSGRGS